MAELEDESLIIFFGEKATAGLEDYSHIIPVPRQMVSVAVGDVLQIGREKFAVTAVGGRVDENFNALGHFTARFDGSPVAELPGTVHLKGSPPKVLEEDLIAIEREKA